ncbi:RNP domain protein [Ascosphaera apis ARSEF 7405]|uniref:RNP domain protein n=1 Tax=Ascosphaera apis ARSEF 7405 TaxID=392613 RepID=A0A167YZG9_9EURO|nr:RNP domain protein [Ascosphaera apis ARSEF 7405]
MSFPPPPGTNPPRRPAAPTSLPARPPTTAAPTYYAAPGTSAAAATTAPGVPSYGGYQTGFQPRSVASPGYQYGQYGQHGYYGAQQGYHNNYGQSYPTAASPAVTAAGPAASTLPYRNQYSAGPQSAGTTASAAGPTAAPAYNRYNHNRQNANTNNADYDPETEAAIAQWQSAYINQDAQAATMAAATAVPGTAPAIGPTIGPSIGAATPSTATASLPAPAVAGPQLPGGQQPQQGPAANGKTVIRQGGGQKWTDPSLLEWDPAHFRLFVGNLAGEVTDESLFKAFSKYTSISKARVIRDKRTEKSKGYGFVSFADGDDYFKAAREMQGKYIGSHPVLLKKAVTEIKAVPVSAVKKNGKKKSGSGIGTASVTSAGENATASEKKKHKGESGISKKQPKTRGGLKILG